jgi:hypothetical protein
MYSIQDHRGLQGPMELDPQTLPPRRVAFLKTNTKIRYDSNQFNARSETYQFLFNIR